MLNIETEFKELYKQKNIPKSLSIPYPSIGVTITNKNIVSESLELQEKICADDKINFGACIASQIKFTVANITEDLKGQEFTVDQIVDKYTMPFGIFTVDSCPKQSDDWFKDVTAYDRMKKIEVDVAAWYNGLFPTGNESYNLAVFRSSFLAYVGLEEDTSRLPLSNDSMIITKTIDSPAQLSGRMVIEAIEELNGCFGHINRYGKFTHIILDKSFVDYPQDDYPGSDYPEEEPYEQIEPYMYVQNGVKFEEYTVKMIDKLIIRQEENDVGAIYGIGTNAYIIQGNFLFYGKSASDLQRIAENIAKNVFGRGYRPYTADLIGLPYVEVGDTVKYQTDDTVAGYVLSRTLKGIQALRDTYEAQGSEVQTENVGGTNYEIKQLKGRSAKIEKSVDAVKVTVSDLDTKLSGEIDVLAGQVVLKVDANGNVGYVDLSADPNTDLTTIKIKADQHILEGLITANGNFKVLLDGSIEAVNGKFSGDITASEFVGGNIRSENYSSGNAGMMIDLNNSTIDMVNLHVDATGKITATNGTFNGTVTSQSADGYEVVIENGDIICRQSESMAIYYKLSTGEEGCTFDNINCSNLNGGTPITTANKDSFTYPPGGDYATNLSVYNNIESVKLWVSNNFVSK